jgi:hypothetical protein
MTIGWFWPIGIIYGFTLVSLNEKVHPPFHSLVSPKMVITWFPYHHFPIILNQMLPLEKKICAYPTCGPHDGRHRTALRSQGAHHAGAHHWWHDNLDNLGPPSRRNQLNQPKIVSKLLLKIHYPQVRRLVVSRCFNTSLPTTCRQCHPLSLVHQQSPDHHRWSFNSNHLPEMCLLSPVLWFLSEFTGQHWRYISSCI